MFPLHQMYCTHCTRGNSALEDPPRAGDQHAERPLGYSVRAGSLDAEMLRKVYQRVERFIYYQLPADTPGEDKAVLTADAAPRRLVYQPAADGLRMLALVCYRSHDTQGRVGSYFGHVLFDGLFDGGGGPADSTASPAAWSVLDALALWGAEEWVDEDSPEIDGPLAPLAHPAELMDGAPAAIDEQVLHSFLTTPAGDGFLDPHGIIPHRWKSSSPAKRQRLFARAMQGFLERGDPARDVLLLVAEPALAALLFYGILRLLPPGPLREQVSFSTYEPDPKRLCTLLAATTFHDPAAGELDGESDNGRIARLDTFTVQTGRPVELGTYTRSLLGDLLGEGWPAVDRKLAHFAAAGARSPADLETLAKADKTIELLAASLDRCAELPPGCERLLKQSRNLPSARPSLLAQVVLRLDQTVLLKWLDNLPEEHHAGLLLATLRAARVDPGKLAALGAVVERLDAAWLCRLLNEYGQYVLPVYPAKEPALAGKLVELLDTLPDAPREFAERMNVLVATRERLPPGDSRLLGWMKVRQTIQEIDALRTAGRLATLRKNHSSALDKLAMRLAQGAVDAMPEHAARDDDGGYRTRRLQLIVPALLEGRAAADLLPSSAWGQIRSYFQTGLWRRGLS